MINLLFSYGTLRQSEVQRALFGREVLTTEDVLPGFRLDVMLITEPDVIAKSGSDKHPILRRSSAEDVAHGALLELSDAELSAADSSSVACVSSDTWPSSASGSAACGAAP